ncbi:MAG TPA: chemotaxis protein CheW [Blastocatellia bacterium]|nr:chemotaxis protein CheW [Blastocatellia bacterium]
MKDQRSRSSRKRAAHIDWSEIHRRMETTQSALERNREPGPEEKKNILRTRARLLAQEKEASAGGVSLEVVEFLLAYEHYALETFYLSEVYPLRELMPLPCTPPFILGLINARGRLLPVIDLKKFFGLPDQGLTNLSKVIIVRAPDIELGILAEVVLGVRVFRLPEIHPPPPTLTGIRVEYLRGITSEGLVILDVSKILAAREIIVNEEVET